MNIQQAPKQEDWILKSIKMKPSGSSVHIKSEYTLSNGVEHYIMPKVDNLPIPAHGDFMDALNSLKLRLASSLGFTMFDSLVKSDEFQADAAQQKYSKILLEKQLQMISVHGVSYPGKNRRCIKIHGEYNGQELVTSKLSFDNNDYGDSLEETVELITQEAYEYLYLGKKAQLEAVFLS